MPGVIEAMKLYARTQLYLFNEGIYFIETFVLMTIQLFFTNNKTF